MAAYQILIADDHPLFRSALHQALSLGLGSEVQLAEAASIAELEQRLTQKSDWDLVLLDLPGWLARERWRGFFRRYREDLVGFLLGWATVAGLVGAAWGLMQIGK